MSCRKVYSTNLSSHSHVRHRMDSLKTRTEIHAAESEISFFISHILLSCGQKLAPTLPTMQLGHQQFSQRCVMLVTANVTLSRDEERATEVW